MKRRTYASAISTVVFIAAILNGSQSYSVHAEEKSYNGEVTTPSLWAGAGPLPGVYGVNWFAGQTKELAEPWLGNQDTLSSSLHAEVQFRPPEKSLAYAFPFLVAIRFEDHGLLFKSSLLAGTRYEGGMKAAERDRITAYPFSVGRGRHLIFFALPLQPPLIRAVLACVSQQDLPKEMRTKASASLPELDALIAQPVAAIFDATAQGSGKITSALTTGRAKVEITTNDSLASPDEKSFEGLEQHAEASLKYYPASRSPTTPIERTPVTAQITTEVTLHSGPGYRRRTIRSHFLTIAPVPVPRELLTLHAEYLLPNETSRLGCVSFVNSVMEGSIYEKEALTPGTESSEQGPNLN